MAITNSGQISRTSDRLRLATCFLIPAILLIAHFMHGSDTLAASSWVGVLSCLSLAAIMLIRPADDTPVSTLVMFAILAVFVLLGWAGNWHQARTEVIQLATAILLWTGGAMIARSRRMLMTSWAVLSAGFALIALLALLSYPMMAASSSSAEQLGHAYRMSFSFRSPNTMASLMGLGVIVSLMHLAYMLRARVATGIPLLAKFNYIPREGYPAILAFVLCLTCLFLTLSRAAIFLTLTAVAIIAVCEIFVRRSSETLKLAKYRYHLILGVIAGFVALVLLVISLGDVADRADTLHVDGAGRWALLSEYWQAWQAKPVFGHGLGSFNRINESITTMNTASLLVLLGAAHNVVLQWLLQVGLVGLTTMAAIQLAFHYKIARGAFQRAYRTQSYLSRMLLLVSGFVFLHNMIDFPLEIPSIMWTYAFLLGLACGMPKTAGARGDAPA